MRGPVLALITALPLMATADQAPPVPPAAMQPQPRPIPRPQTGPQAGTTIPRDTATPPLSYSPSSRAKTASEGKRIPRAATAAPMAANEPPIREQLRESDFDYSACLLELTLLGADYSEEPPVTDDAQRDCGIARPIRLLRPLPMIEIDGGALMRCDTARHLARWLRDFVRPATAMLPGQPRLIALEPGSTYQCRTIVGNNGEKLSEHAFGNALDIAAFRFDDGSQIAIEPRQGSGDLPEAFQRTVRAAACLHFTTVLGPGTNAAHEGHLHLDIKARESGWRLCQ